MITSNGCNVEMFLIKINETREERIANSIYTSSVTSRADAILPKRGPITRAMAKRL